MSHKYLAIQSIETQIIAQRVRKNSHGTNRSSLKKRLISKRTMQLIRDNNHN